METINKGGYMAEFYTDINKEVFEEKNRCMFDSIWDCEIDQPIFQDTVGELMGAVIALWDNCHSTVSPFIQPEIIRCKDCKQFRRWIDTDICFCDITEAEMSDNDFCSKAERWEE